MIPDISVILPVFNGSRYLNNAIDSIRSQTFTNFELIIIDDGSKDNSPSLVNSYSDSRIRFYKQSNQGLAATLNRCITLATGKYIARQDQDDISQPSRFEKQVAFLEGNPDYGMVGTWASILEGDSPTARFHKHPPDNLSLQFDLLFDNPFVHSSMMLRKSVFDSVGHYSTDRNRQPPEDYELWSRVARKFRLANLPEVLHVYREMPGSMSRTGDKPFLEHLLKINMENLSRITNGNFTENSLYDLAVLAHGACHKFSGTTSLRELLAIVREAAKKLGQEEKGGDLSQLNDKVAFRLNSIRYHYYRSKCMGAFGNSASLLLVRIIRKFKTLL